MEDLTGLGKVLESQVAREVYKDGLKEPVKQTSETLVDFLKSMRLFTAPFQLLAAWQDRLRRYCDRVREGVPEERQIQAPASIAGPVLMDLRFMEEDNPVTELFLNLLRRAIDRVRVHQAHPAYVKVIEQLSADEAMILYWFRVKKTNMAYIVFEEEPQSNSLDVKMLKYPEQVKFSAMHLETLGLLYNATSNFVMLTEFGKAFIEACVPERFEVIRDEDLPPNPFPETESK